MHKTKNLNKNVYLKTAKHFSGLNTKKIFEICPSYEFMYKVSFRKHISEKCSLEFYSARYKKVHDVAQWAGTRAPVCQCPAGGGDAGGARSANNHCLTRQPEQPQ